MKLRIQLGVLTLALVTLAATALVLLSPRAGRAQETLRLERLEVAIWPEYDQPAALVMLRAWLPDDLPLPVSVPLPMPAAVTTPNAVAKRSADGSLLLADYLREERGEWSILHVEADAREIRLEYYVDMMLTQPRRQFDFEWPGGLDIARVSYELQQPTGATELVAIPPSTAQTSGDDGLTYRFAELGPRSAAEPFSIALSYTKTTPTLSIASAQPTFPPPTQPAPSAPPESGGGSATAAQATSEDSSTWLVVLPIVFVVGAIVVWLAIRGEPRGRR